MFCAFLEWIVIYDPAAHPTSRCAAQRAPMPADTYGYGKIDANTNAKRKFGTDLSNGAARDGSCSVAAHYTTLRRPSVL